MKALAQYLSKFVFNMSQVSLFFICSNEEAKLLTRFLDLDIPNWRGQNWN
jgi:hypothetical protein